MFCTTDENQNQNHNQGMICLPYIEFITENRYAFVNKVTEISGRLGINPGWLMIVFYIETAASRYGVINHRIVNELGAVGLIQFMPATQRALGISAVELTTMSNVRQLDYVYKYLLPYSGKMKTLADTYLAVFFPAAIGKPANWVLKSANLSPETIACWNPLYDLDKDKRLTVGEITAKLKTFVPDYYEPYIANY